MLGELTLREVQRRAEELRTLVASGTPARAALLALAWHELGDAMKRTGAVIVAELGEKELVQLAPRLSAVLPSPR